MAEAIKTKADRVIYYTQKRKDGSVYPTNMILYKLDLESVTAEMSPEGKMLLYRRNAGVIQDAVDKLPSLKGYSVQDATGKYGSITFADGTVKKVRDAVKEIMAEHEDDDRYTRPKNIFFDYAVAKALFQFFQANPERKKEYLMGGKDGSGMVLFCDNFSTSPDTASPAEAMMMYQYLEKTGQTENVLKNFFLFRSKMIADYFKPQVEHVFILSQNKAKKNFPGNSPEDRKKYADAIARAEGLRDKALREIGVLPPLKSEQVKKTFLKNKQKTEVEKKYPFPPDYKLKVAEEIAKEDSNEDWKKLPSLRAVNADAGGGGSRESFDKDIFSFTPDEVKALASEIRLIPGAYRTFDEKKEALFEKVQKSRELRELLYRSGDRKEIEKILREAGAGDDAEVFLSLRDDKRIPMPSGYQLAAMSGFRKGETRAIIAVPGSGKTTSLIYTIESLLAQKKVKPNEITMISFTTGAAAEFRKRILERNPDLKGAGIQISTAHSLARSILRKYAPGVPIDILTESDQDDLIANKVIPETLAMFSQHADEEKWKKDLKTALQVIMLAPWSEKQMHEASEEYGFPPEQLKAAYDIYSARKEEKKKIDYNDLIINAMKILETNDRARAEVQAHAGVLMVDEYQDTSPMQRAFEKLLRPEGGIKIEVGDDHQAIFSSLGARAEYLQDDAVANADSFYVLPTNYRSTPALIEAFNDIKDSIEDSSRKEMFAAKEKGEDCKVEIREFSLSVELNTGYGSGKEKKSSSTYKKNNSPKMDPETAYILEDIKKRLEAGEKAENIAILCRKNDDVKELRDAIYKDPEMRKSLPKEENNPIISRFAGNHAARTLRPILESVAEPGNGELFNKLLDTFLYNSESLHVEKDSTDPIGEFKRRVDENDGQRPQKAAFLKAYEAALEKEDARTAVETFLYSYSGYDSIEEYWADKASAVFASERECKIFLDELDNNNVARAEGLTFATAVDEMSLTEKRVEKEPGLNIKTVHKAKGEEYDTVYMYRQDEDKLNGMNEKITDPVVRAKHRIEEDKIAYTGATRAKKNLIITGTSDKIAKVYGRISGEHVLWYRNGIQTIGSSLNLKELGYKEIKGTGNKKMTADEKAKYLSRLS